MHKLYWNELLPHRNFSLVGTLPLLQLCPCWKYSLAGTAPRLELCPGWNSSPTGTPPQLEPRLGWNSASSKCLDPIGSKVRIRCFLHPGGNTSKSLSQLSPSENVSAGAEFQLGARFQSKQSSNRAEFLSKQSSYEA